MAGEERLGTLRHPGLARAPRSGWARRFFGAVLLALGIVALMSGARAELSFEWATVMGGTGRQVGNSIAVDAEGNVYTTGYFQGTTNFGPFQLTAPGNERIFVTKQSPDGSFLWARSMGGTGNDEGYGIAVDATGNVYTTGRFQRTANFGPFQLTSAGARDIFVSKQDAAGNFVWARAMGGTGEDVGRGIAVDGDGNILITGWFWGTANFGPLLLTSPGYMDIFVSKLYADGNVDWAHSMGGTDSSYGFDITVDGAGHVYTTGYFWGTANFDTGPGTFELVSAGRLDIFVSKHAPDGTFLWARSFGDTYNDWGISIAADVAGNVYTTGHFWGTVDFDPGAGTFSLSSTGNSDIFVSKLDADGNFVWARAMGSRYRDQGHGIAVGATGHVYTTGKFYDTARFDTSTAAFTLNSLRNQDIFLSKLNVDGNFVWARAMGGFGSGYGYDLALDSTGNVYITGLFSGTVDFDPGPGVFHLTSAGESDTYVVKLSPNLEPPDAISIAPSTTGPTSASSLNFTVEFDKAVANFDEASDLVIDHAGTANTGATIAGGPESYTVTVEGIGGDGSFTLAVNAASDVVDLAGNPLASSVTSLPVVIDNTAPTISALTVSPSALAPGDGALIQFEVSEMLLGDPVVQVAGTPAALAPLEAVKSLSHSYSWTAPADLPVGRITGRTLLPGIGYINPDPWPYGAQSLEITLTDLAGNTITHTEPEGLVLVSGLPVAWPGLAALAMLFAAAFVLRRSRQTTETPRHGGRGRFFTTKCAKITKED